MPTALITGASTGLGRQFAALFAADCDPEAVSRLVRLNVQTLTDLTMLHLPRMVARGHGSILNVSSLAAYVVPHGLEAVYAASKAYVMSFSESLAQDLRGSSVTCTHLAPGPTRTEFFAAAGLDDDARMDGFAMDAAPVAHAGYEAMRAGRVAVMPGWANKVLRTAAVLSPSAPVPARPPRAWPGR